MRRALMNASPEDRDVLSVLAASAPANKPGISRGVAGVLLALIVILLTALLTLAGYMLSQYTKHGVKIAPGSDATSKTATFGQPVRDGQFEFVAAPLECGGTPAGLSPVSESDMYCVSAVHVTNVGLQPRMISCSWLLARLDGGDTVPADNPSTSVRNGGAITEWVGPGSETSFHLVFIVDRGAQILGLELHDFAFSQGAVITGPPPTPIPDPTPTSAA